MWMYNFFLWVGIIFFTTIGYSQSLDEVKLIDSLSVSLKKYVVASDFENAAFVVFVVLLTRAILTFDLNFYMPISRVDQNMQVK